MSTHNLTKRVRALMWGTAVAALAAPSLSWAQSTPPSDSAAAAEDEDDIIVTAQRRSEALEDVPMTVNVVNQDTLSNLGVNSVRDLQNVTSGLMVNNSGSTTNPAIRGITTTNPGNYENNVALFVDGVYQSVPAILNMDIPNVQNIQILKGPQGTLYGRNATGGAILIDTINPTNEWQANAEMTYGRFDDRRARGYVAGPLTEGVGISLSGTYRQTDGYYKIASRTTPGATEDRGVPTEQESFRAKVKFDLSDSFRAIVGYNFLYNSDARANIFTPVENVKDPYDIPGRNTRGREVGVASGDVFDIWVRQHEGSLRLEADTGIGMLRSITAYSRTKNQVTYDSGGSYVPDGYGDSITLQRDFQQSVDFAINAIDNLDLVIGGNYYKLRTSYLPGHENVFAVGPAAYAFPGPNPATTVVPLSDYRFQQTVDARRQKEAWAVFIDATVHVTDQLSLNIGGRYSKESQDVAAQKTYYCFTTGGCAGGVPVGGITSQPYTFATSPHSSSYKKFTPRASIRYEIAPRTNIYASYSQGFRGGEWNSVPPTPDQPGAANWFDAKQESVEAFEVGFKTAKRGFHFDLAAFYYKYKDLQVSTTTFVNGIAVVALQNSPSAKVYGAEANFDYRFTDNLTVRGGATWLHARYGDGFIYSGTGVNPNGIGYNPQPDPLKTAPNVTGVSQDLSGLQMARAPNFQAFLGAEYNIPKGDGGIRFAANIKYSTSYVVTDPAVWGGEPTAAFFARQALDPNALPNNGAILAGTGFENRANEQRARQPAFALINASVTWTDPKDHYYVRIWGNNLTDRTVRLHYRPSTAGTYIPIGEPLTFGVTAGFKL